MPGAGRQLQFRLRLRGVSPCSRRTHHSKLLMLMDLTLSCCDAAHGVEMQADERARSNGLLYLLLLLDGAAAPGLPRAGEQGP
jgi:hypothetical protein